MTTLAPPATAPDPAHRDAALALGDEADARSAEMEAIRRVPDDLYRAAALAGLFRQLVVTDLGGLGGTPLDWFRTGVELARREASFGWVVTQGAAALGWIGAGADDRWAAQLLRDPGATSASSIAGMGSLSIDGERARFGGRWASNTGCHGATWIGRLALVAGSGDGGGPPQVRWAWVPAERARIVEDWEPDGLWGTGSHTTVVADQEIPTAWTFDPASPTTNDRGPHRCLVGNGNWPIATSVAATQLGNARRALDEARSVVTTKAPAPDFAPLAGNAAVQRGLVEAEGLWQAALAGVERELGSMWDEAVDRGELSTGQRVRLHAANVTANRLAVRVVDLVCALTGTAALPHAGVLGRCRRDAHALEGHIATGGAAAEHNAKVGLGLSPGHRIV